MAMLRNQSTADHCNRKNRTWSYRPWSSWITSNIVMNGAFIRIDGKEVFPIPWTWTLRTDVPSSQRQWWWTVLLQWERLLGDWTYRGMIGAYNHVRSPLPEIDPLHYETDRTNMLLVLGVGNDAYYHERFPELTFIVIPPLFHRCRKIWHSKGTGIKPRIVGSRRCTYLRLWWRQQRLRSFRSLRPQNCNGKWNSKSWKSWQTSWPWKIPKADRARPETLWLNLILCIQAKLWYTNEW